MRAWISGESPSAAGSRAGSPIGSLPRGSSRAARWPWVRNALTSAHGGGHVGQVAREPVASRTGARGGVHGGGGGRSARRGAMPRLAAMAS